MSNVTPLGGARSNFIPAPALAADASEPVPIPASAEPASPVLATETATPVTPDAIPADALEPVAGDAPIATATAGPATAEAFDVSEFTTAFEALKAKVSGQRAVLTQDISALKAEDEQLSAQIADWDAKANAAEDRRREIDAELAPKLLSFGQLDEATIHLEATEGLLYPKPEA